MVHKDDFCKLVVDLAFFIKNYKNTACRAQSCAFIALIKLLNGYSKRYQKLTTFRIEWYNSVDCYINSVI